MTPLDSLLLTAHQFGVPVTVDRKGFSVVLPNGRLVRGRSAAALLRNLTGDYDCTNATNHKRLMAKL